VKIESSISSRRNVLIGVGGLATVLGMAETAGATEPAARVVAASDATVGKTIAAADGTRIFYKDWGSGKPIVFSHGWPLTADAWDS
jgi:non-heme chloroperoxidase